MTPTGGRTVQAILLRHGQVAHHRSDVGLTDLGVAQSEAAGRWFAEQGVEIECLLSGERRRGPSDTGNRVLQPAIAVWPVLPSCLNPR